VLLTFSQHHALLHCGNTVYDDLTQEIVVFSNTHFSTLLLQMAVSGQREMLQSYGYFLFYNLQTRVRSLHYNAAIVRNSSYLICTEIICCQNFTLPHNISHFISSDDDVINKDVFFFSIPFPPLFSFGKLPNANQQLIDYFFINFFFD